VKSRKKVLGGRRPSSRGGPGQQDRLDKIGGERALKNGGEKTSKGRLVEGERMASTGGKEQLEGGARGLGGRGLLTRGKEWREERGDAR